jgi:hypothetical protein
MKKTIWYLSIIIAVCVIGAALQYYHSYQPWFAVHTGAATGQESSGYYAYWSGFGSVFPWEFGLFLTVGAWFATHYRLNNCHVEKCPWIGKYPVADGHYKVCRKHHPEAHVRHKRVSFEHIQATHALHLLKAGMIKLPEHHEDST